MTLDEHEAPKDALENAEQKMATKIVVVLRGDCSFVTKVKVAAKKGAHAVIIVDKEDSTMSSHDLQKVIVADDGWGGNIRIPSVLISRFDGEPLIEAAKKGEVIVELSWDIPTGEVVDIDLWMNSAAADSQHFLKNFAKSRKALNEVVKFTPHYDVFSADPELNGYSGLCSDSSARYCAADPDGAGPISGKDVLEEDVRQLCIHEITKVPRSRHRGLSAEGEGAVVFYAEKWWNYVEKFAQKCPVDASKGGLQFGKECSEKLMEELGIDISQVQNCVATSSNAKLESELVNKAWSPRALRVNGWRYSGLLEADLVTKAVCSGFVDQPEECKSLLAPPEQSSNMEVGSGISARVMMLSAAALVSASFCAMMLYRRSLEQKIRLQIREDVMLEVTDQLAQYCKMETGEAGDEI